MSFARQEQRLILSDLSDAEGIVDRPLHVSDIETSLAAQYPTG